ncbi:MAG: hypothetical protein KH828_04665 [Clostridiales bacterium]|nr:hypothetical protein [Clostridiales bacterium]
MNVQNFEQQLSLYTDIKIYCGIAALVLLALTIALFFWLKIPETFAELTGKKARRAVRQMTEDNPESGSLKSSKTEEEGQKNRKVNKTDKLNSKKLPQKRSYVTSMEHTLPKTDKLPTTILQEEGITAKLEEQTVPLGEADYENGETGVLENQTVPLSQAGYENGETSVLGNQSVPFGQVGYENGETSVLGNQTVPLSGAGYETEGAGIQKRTAAGFIIERSIVEIHTDEVI